MPIPQSFIAATDTHETETATTDADTEAYETSESTHTEDTTTTHATTESDHGSESESGIGVLGLDPLAILLQAGTFILLFLLIRRFALEKIVKVLDDRQQRIDESLRTADEIEKRDRANREETEKLLKEAREEAEGIVALAHEESGAIVKAAETAAATRTAKMLADAEAKTAADIVRATKELKSEMLNLVAEATEAIIGEKLDAVKDRELLERAIKGRHKS